MTLMRMCQMHNFYKRVYGDLNGDIFFLLHHNFELHLKVRTLKNLIYPKLTKKLPVIVDHLELQSVTCMKISHRNHTELNLSPNKDFILASFVFVP